jgi:hypothetical protein
VKKLAYAALGIVGTALAITVVVAYHASWWPLVVFAILPDLSFLFGMSSGLARGQLHPRAVPIYNALHRYWVPVALIGSRSSCNRRSTWLLGWRGPRTSRSTAVSASV